MISWVLGKVGHWIAAWRSERYSADIDLRSVPDSSREGDKQQQQQQQQQSPLSLHYENLVIEIHRDEWAIPHIFCKSAQGVIFGQGFAQAQSRLFQMELMRRMAMGTLSELVGEMALPLDRMARILGWHRLAAMEVRDAPAESLKYAQSFVDGINAYIRSDVYSKPVELTLLRQANPEPWTIEHVVAIGRLLCFQLNRGFYVKFISLILEHEMSNTGSGDIDINDHSADTFLDLLRHFNRSEMVDPNVPPTLPKGNIEVNWDMLQQLHEYIPQDQGSNWMIVSPIHTANGHALVAADPHLSRSLPSVWFESHLVCDQFDVIGAQMPGIYGICFGHNRHFSTCVTLSYADVADIYVEQFDAKDTDRYMYCNEWYTCDVVEEKINVKGRSEPLVERVRITRHGPVIGPLMFHISKSGDENNDAFTEDFSIRATYLEHVPGVLTIDQFRVMNSAKDWDGFVSTMHNLGQLSVNVGYADVRGNIGYYMSGWLPKRSEKALKRINLPLDGSTDQYEWLGFVDLTENPHCLNPEQGFIVSANHKIADDSYPHFIGNCFKRASRATRITDLINQILFVEKRKIGMDDLRRMQLDCIDICSADSKDFIKMAELTSMQSDVQEELHKQAVMLSNLTDTSIVSIRHVTEFLRSLQQWDGDASLHSTGASLHVVFHDRMLRLVLKEKLGIRREKAVDALMGCGISEQIFAIPEFHSHDAEILNSVVQVMVQNENGKRMTQLLAWRAIIESIMQIRHLLHITPDRDPAKEISQYHYGKLHAITFNHPMGKFIPAFNRGPYEIGGTGHTPNQTAHLPNGKSYEAFVIPSYRMLIDMGNLDHASAVQSLGQSGNPSSKHYDDMLHMWLEGEYHPLYLSRQDVIQHSQGCIKIYLGSK